MPLTGWLRLDPAVAALVALNILWTGYKMLRESVGGLMDEVADPGAVAELRRVIVKDGDRATVTVPELVNRTFEGTVARNAQALATGTRTLLTEVDVDNNSSEFAAGLYCVIRLQRHRAGPVVRVPSQALIFNKDGLSAAVVSNGKMKFRKLELDTDNGADVEVRAGLRAIALSLAHRST